MVLLPLTLTDALLLMDARLLRATRMDARLLRATRMDALLLRLIATVPMAQEVMDMEATVAMDMAMTIIMMMIMAGATADTAAPLPPRGV